MLARTHLAAALLGGLIFEPLHLMPDQRFLYYFLIMIAALLPDLDHPGSTLGHQFPFASFVFGKLFGHRGLFHALMVPLLLFWLSNHYFIPAVGMAVLVGMLSHLLCDSLTTQGVNLLHPFTDFRVRGIIPTGGVLETLFFSLLLIAIGWKLF